LALAEIDVQFDGRGAGDVGDDALLPELWMLADDLARSDRDVQIAQRRDADVLAVDRDFGTSRRIDAHDALGRFDRERSRLARVDVEDARLAVTERGVGQQQLVPASRHDELPAFGRADEVLALGDLQLERREDGDPAREDRFVERLFRARLDRDGASDRSLLAVEDDGVRADGEIRNRHRGDAPEFAI